MNDGCSGARFGLGRELVLGNCMEGLRLSSARSSAPPRALRLPFRGQQIDGLKSSAREGGTTGIIGFDSVLEDFHHSTHIRTCLFVARG